MKRKKIIFEKVGISSDYRCLLKNQHGRKIYMKLKTENEKWIFLNVGKLIGTSVRQVIKENRLSHFCGKPKKLIVTLKI